MSENERMTQRIDAAMKRCENYVKEPNFSYTNIQGYAWLYTPKNLAYCITPKVGCTFWKQVFRFIAGDYSNKNISRPDEIDRMEVHHTRLKTVNIQQRYLVNPVSRQLISQKHIKTFMFSRDPYTRLWSAYIDKLLLPDFWQSQIARDVVLRLGGDASRIQEKCWKEISFSELTKYVIYMLTHRKKLDDHFSPIYQLCSPCHLRFDVLGKLETFENDASYIFKSFDLENLLNLISFSLNVSQEVSMLTKYNFVLARREEAVCRNLTFIAQRLWKAFQVNGYISKSIPALLGYIYAMHRSKRFQELFQEKVLQTIKEQNVTREALRRQKREYLIAAYHQLSVSDLKMIPKLFRPDFELFGYEKYPKYIFPV